MKGTVTEKILTAHLLQGELKTGCEILMQVDQTLTQDSTGTMVYLQLESMGVDHIQTQRSVAYIDHNMLQAGFENADDHTFIQSCAEKYGIVFSKPGGGICHQVHLERFARPGITLIGSDSHTPTCGGLGAIAIGAGGLDVAVGMAKGYYNLQIPRLMNVRLTGMLQPGVNAKDVILTILEQLTVKGGVGYILEYSGEGVKNLSVTDRATICNMGAELGATTSVFPSDGQTLAFLTRQGRPEDFQPLQAEKDAVYDAVLDIDLSAVQPMAAKPHSPDAVASVNALQGLKIDQVCIGSCTNSSYADLMKAALILKDRRVHPEVSLTLSPGSSNILRMLSENGALAIFVKAGARILESACGPCIGMGQAPKSQAVSLRTFNRNFRGRSGTMDAQVYLVSPETAAASAITGVLTNPTTLNLDFSIQEPDSYGRSDHYFIFPEDTPHRKEIIMGPNIKPFPSGTPLTENLTGTILLKTGDNVTTDDIVPSNARLLPYRSNIPHLANYCFGTLCSDFKARAEKNQGGFVTGGENYGQGSSREHAALVPLYLGVRAVLAKSFARIHRSNLINAGILPLVFADPAQAEWLEEGDCLTLENIPNSLEKDLPIPALIKNKHQTIQLISNLSRREKDIIRSGGFLNYEKNRKIEAKK